MTMTSPSTAERIAQRGRLELLARLRSAFEDQARQTTGTVRLDPDELQRLVAEAAGRAGGALWRRSLAEGAIAELGIDLATAVEHPEVLRAHELVGAPPYEPPGTQAAEPDPRAASTPEPELAEADPEPPAEPELAEADPEPPAEPEPAEADPEPPAAPEPPGPDQERETLRIAAVHTAGIESLRAGEPDIELRFSDAGLDVLKRSTGAAIGRLDWSDIDSIELLPPRRGLRVSRRKMQKLRVETDRGRASFELHGVTEDQLADYLVPLLERTRGGSAGPPSG
jgi:hypothetical protein